MVKIPGWIVLALGAVLVWGCAMGPGLETPEATLARQVIAEHCVIGTTQSSNGWYNVHIEEQRVGKVDKLAFPIRFRAHLPIAAARVFVHGIEAREGDWMVADVSSNGVRDNLYFNSKTGEFACSAKEWRDIQDFPGGRTFEKSALIRPTGR